jgi:GNAT superfamily N-acetyltransferase
VDWGEVGLRAQAEYLRHLAASGTHEVRREGGALAVASGAKSNTENGVVGSRLDPIRADSLIAELVAWFADSELPACWLCPERPGALADRLVAAGCRAEQSGIEMGIGLAQLPAAAEADVVSVRDERLLDAWLDVAVSCGWAEDDAERLALRRLLVSDAFERAAPVRLAVVMTGDRPAAMGRWFVAPPNLLLQDVAVAEHERRRGLGRALVLAAAADGRAAGCRACVLAPTPEGAKLAASLGFETAPLPRDRWFYLPVSARAAR